MEIIFPHYNSKPYLQKIHILQVWLHPCSDIPYINHPREFFLCAQDTHIARDNTCEDYNTIEYIAEYILAFLIIL